LAAAACCVIKKFILKVFSSAPAATGSAQMMPWIYGVYLFLATVNGPVLFALATIGKSVPCRLIVIDSNSSSYAVQDSNLSMEAGGAAMLAMFFAVLFMITTRHDDAEVDTDVAIMMRICFWCFVFYNGCILHCGWPSAVTRDGIYVATCMRTMALWALCRTAPEEKRAALLCGAGLYIIWIVAYFEHYYYDESIAMMIITSLVIVMDGLLALGHGYDDITTHEIKTNCRLCYTAISVWAAIAMMLLVF
jgi:hypothetical protein